MHLNRIGELHVRASLQKGRGLWGENITCKRPRATGSQIGHYDIYNDTEGRYFNTSLDGQHGCPGALVENMRNKERTVGHHEQEGLGLSLAMQDHNYCRIYSENNKYKSRQGIKANQGFQRVEIKTQNIQTSITSHSDPTDRLACI